MINGAGAAETGSVPGEADSRRVRTVDDQQRVKTKRRAVLDEMTRTAAEDGSYDEGTGFVQTR